jgi:hypothetical protein
MNDVQMVAAFTQSPFSRALAAEASLLKKLVYLVLCDLPRRCELVDVVYEALGVHYNHEHDRLASGVSHIVDRINCERPISPGRAKQYYKG